MIVIREKISVVSICVLAIAIASFGELPQTVVKYGLEFARDVVSIDVDYAATTNNLPLKYVRDLENLSAKFQKDGDLDGLLAVKNEIKRFKKLDRSELDPFEAVPDMTDDDIVSSPAELRTIQEEYRRGFSAAKTDCKKKIRERGEKLLAEIEEEKTELTKAGKIDEAVAVRDSIAVIEAKIKSGDVADVIRVFGVDAASVKAAVASKKASATTTAASAKTSWRAWKYRSVMPFARELQRYVDPDIPNELTAYFDQNKGVAKVTGIRKTPTRQVGDTLCSWIGKAFIWDVADARTLEADVHVKAKTLSSSSDRGPFLELAVLANGARVKALSVPVMRGDDRVRIVRKNDNEFELFWPHGKVTKPFTVPSGARLNVLVGVVLHNSREMCDVSFQLEDPAK